MPQLHLSVRSIQLCTVVSVIGLLSFGYFLELVQGLEPCPLCITQRFFLLLTAVLALIAFLHKPTTLGTWVYSATGAICALAGAGFSSRQLYLQSLPADQVPACGPSISFIFEAFPLNEALSILLRGDGNCAEVTWRFLGLSIPGWTLVVFITFAIGWLVQPFIQRAIKTA